MVMRRVFDPRTRKWTIVETAPPVSPPSGTVPAATTATTVPRTSTTVPNIPTGTTVPRSVVPTTTPRATTTTVPRTSTTIPSTTTTVPRTTTTTVPRSTTTTTVPKSTTTTTVPASTTGSAATAAAEAAGAAAAAGLFGESPTSGTSQSAGTTDDSDWLAGLKALNTPSASPTTAQKRDAGLAAARELERFGQQAQGLYGTQASQLAAALQDAYSPFFGEQRSGIETQRLAQLKFLADQYGAGQQAINAATQAALAGIPQQSAAYSQVPLVELRGGENPLMGALATFGASREPVDVQAGADAQLAAQLAQMSRGAAGQLNTAQQAMLDAARMQATESQSRALQQAALNRQIAEMGVSADTRKALQSILGEEANAAANIEQARQSLLSKGIESLLGGLEAGAKQRATTIQKYGPPKTKPKPKGKGKGKSKGSK